MQQTSKYQFNLVDSTDDFSPVPLNQNAQKTEDLIEGVEQDLSDMAEELDALSAGLGSGGKTCRVAWGTYTGTGTTGADQPTVFNFDFRPVMLVVERKDGEHEHPFIIIQGVTQMPMNFAGYHLTYVTWGDRQIKLHGLSTADVQFNMSGWVYQYLALGYDDT